MAEQVRVLSIRFIDDDSTGPVRADIELEVSDNAISSNVAALGGGRKVEGRRGRLSRAAWNTLLGNVKRLKGDSLPGSLQGLCPIAEEP